MCTVCVYICVLYACVVYEYMSMYVQCSVYSIVVCVGICVYTCINDVICCMCVSITLI